MGSATMHVIDSDALAVLRCPRCPHESLGPFGGVLRCSVCSREYPLFGSIPCLLEDPGLWRASQLNRLSEYLSVMDMRIRGLRSEAELPGLLPKTRARVLRVVEAFEDQSAGIDGLMGDLKQAAAILPPSAMPARPGQEGKLALIAFYENLFRDWCWGDGEAEKSRSLVERAASQPLGQLAVYGAGAARLAFDVHQTLGPEQTFALDTNPLPMLVADRLLRGEAVDLYEFPMAPISEEHVVVQRRLQGRGPAREGFHLIFADAFRPPFAPGSLDSVLTPWFIDAVPVDFRHTAAAINRALSPGGVWINLGPLRFPGGFSRSYPIEEVLDIVGLSAFDVLSHGVESVPYFDSPVSGSRRRESVVCFAARKIGEAPRVEPPSVAPRWVTDPDVPIPLTASMGALRQSSIFAASVIALVDGTRSMSDVAVALAASWGVEPARIQDHLRAFFATLPPD
jgi:uncharacterized protein YbaR (Trm112 family)